MHATFLNLFYCPLYDQDKICDKDIPLCVCNETYNADYGVCDDEQYG